MFQCKHQWVDDNKEFNPPRDTVKKCENLTADLYRQTLYGITNITQRCSKCNKINVITVAGRAM